MAIFKGIVYVKHGRIGTRSEGPDYYLQTRKMDYLLQFKPRQPFEPDYELEYFARKIVEIEGELGAGGMILKVNGIKQLHEGGIPPCDY